MDDDKTDHLVNRLREVFHHRRYGTNAKYHPDFDLFDAAADEIDRLRAGASMGKYWKEQYDKACDHLQRVRAALSNGTRGSDT